jgi:hypothetical protein
MKDCYVELLKVYEILEEANKKGLISDEAKTMIGVELDSLDFVCKKGE